MLQHFKLNLDRYRDSFLEVCTINNKVNHDLPELSPVSSNVYWQEGMLDSLFSFHIICQNVLLKSGVFRLVCMLKMLNCANALLLLAMPLQLALDKIQIWSNEWILIFKSISKALFMSATIS